MWRYHYSSELYHHGIKGQKWGVRRTPEQLGHSKNSVTNSSANSTIVSNAIASGEVSLKVNSGNQKKHIKDADGYIEGRSYLNGDIEKASKLINELSGTGEPVMDCNGNWTHKERVSAKEEIGTNVNPKTGEETKTNNAIIVYGKSGSHIYPRKG